MTDSNAAVPLGHGYSARRRGLQWRLIGPAGERLGLFASPDAAREAANRIYEVGRFLTAHCLAARTVAAVDQGWTILSARLLDDDVSELGIDPPSKPADPLDEAVIVFSALATRRKLTGSPDYERPEEIQFVLDALTQAGSPPDKLESNFRVVESGVTAAMERPAVWARIETVAAALQARGELSGEDVRTLLAA